MIWLEDLIVEVKICFEVKLNNQTVVAVAVIVVADFAAVVVFVVDNIVSVVAAVVEAVNEPVAVVGLLARRFLEVVARRFAAGYFVIVVAAGYFVIVVAVKLNLKISF